MRELILKNIKDIKYFNNGFDKSVYRWSNCYLDDKHISFIIFEDLTDEKLLTIYNKIIVKTNKQM